MKKIRIWSVILLCISTAIFAVINIYDWIGEDSKPPVISFPEGELVLSVQADESELLKDVKAEDNRSGNVSGSLVVEELSAFTEDGVRIVTYAAIDEHGNVARRERTLRYEDYQKPQFSLSGPLRFPKGRSVDVLGKVSVYSALDGDLSGNVKYALESTIDVTSTGTYPIEFRVTDSGGNTVYLETNLEIYDPVEERIAVSLTDYVVYLGVNASFSAEDYYAGTQEDGHLEIQSNVDTAVPGTYEVDYVVQGDSGYGKSRLIVVVEE